MKSEHERLVEIDMQLHGFDPSSKSDIDKYWQSRLDEMYEMDKQIQIKEVKIIKD